MTSLADFKLDSSTRDRIRISPPSQLWRTGNVQEFIPTGLLHRSTPHSRTHRAARQRETEGAGVPGVDKIRVFPRPARIADHVCGSGNHADRRQTTNDLRREEWTERARQTPAW